MEDFIAKLPISKQIINETKKFAFRNFKTPKINIPIFFLNKGMILGKIMFADIKENNKS